MKILFLDYFDGIKYLWIKIWFPESIEIRKMDSYRRVFFYGYKYCFLKWIFRDVKKLYGFKIDKKHV